MMYAVSQRKDWKPLIFFVVLSAFSFWWLLRNGLGWYDFPGQWRFGAYTLRGIDIYTLRGSKDFIPEIGEIGVGFHASPWVLVLGLVFYGGFLPYELAVKYFLAISVLLLVIASCLLYQRAKSISQDLSIYAFVVSVLSVDFLIGLHGGNAGPAICACMVIAWCLRNKHEYIAGIFAGFAMVKPQVALIVCFAFLLHRNFKPLITAAAVDIVGCLAASLLLKKSVIELFIEFLTASERVTGFFRGIFHLAFDNYVTSIVMSMLLGIVFVVILYKYLPENMPDLFNVYPACIAVTFWCYSYSADCYILIIPAVICIWLMLISSSTGKCLFWFLSAIYCSNAVSTWGRLNKVFEKMSIEWYLSRTIYEVGLIVLSIIMCVELRRIYMEEKQ